MRLAVFLCVLVSCVFPLISARRKLKSENVAHKPVISSYGRGANYCQVDVARTVEGTGLHRELVTRVFLDEARFTWCVHNSPNSNFQGSAVCNVHIEEHFPSSIYLDPFELKSMESQRNVRAYPRSKIDLEIPNELAEPLTVDMVAADVWPAKNEDFYPIGLDYTMRVPFHVRYHEASENVTSQTVEIPPPARVAFRCVMPQQRFLAPASERYHMKFPHGLNIIKGDDSPMQAVVQAFLGHKEFVQLIVPGDTTAVKFEVAVGDTGHQFFVSPVTSLVSVSAMVIILLGIFRTRQKMKNDANLRKAVEASLQEANAKKEN